LFHCITMRLFENVLSMLSQGINLFLVLCDRAVDLCDSLFEDLFF
jgi:hypothetical protein